MENSFAKLLAGYHSFREKYVLGDNSIMQSLSDHGQQPKTMVVSCCDSRVDPALILQCDPGDLFVVRNVANIIPPYEIDDTHHGTSAALEFGIRYLQVKHLILLGHSQCGGIKALFDETTHHTQNDFITNWVALIKTQHLTTSNPDDYAKRALTQSLQNCMTFPWIRERLETEQLKVHLWFFDVKSGQIETFVTDKESYQAL